MCPFFQDCTIQRKIGNRFLDADFKPQRLHYEQAKSIFKPSTLQKSASPIFTTQVDAADERCKKNLINHHSYWIIIPE